MDWAHFKKTLDWNPKNIERWEDQKKTTLRRGLETEIKKLARPGEKKNDI